MCAIFGQRLVTEDALSAAMCIVEQKLNTRPLTSISSDVCDLEALTSNQFMLGKKKFCSPNLPCSEDFVDHRALSTNSRLFRCHRRQIS